jgi:protein gp37
VSTGIQWTTRVWNPTTGCDRISPGCGDETGGGCYALEMAKRLKAMGSPKYQTDGDPRTSGPGFGVQTHPGVLLDPIVRWPKNGGGRVFVDSMSDLFHARVGREFVARVFATMALTPRYDYQILTKRPRDARRMLEGTTLRDATYDALLALKQHSHVVWSREQADILNSVAAKVQWPLPNVWLGTSVESADYLWRIDELRQTPAVTKFVSLEPLLGPLPELDLTGIDWVIAGGESGSRARPLDLDWVREIRDHCTRQQVAFFFKQVGGRTPKAGGRLLDGRTWDQFPTSRRTARVS